MATHLYTRSITRLHRWSSYGWCQKFKCGGIESFDNIKAFVDLGGKFDAGCVTEAAGTPTGQDAVFAPNVWRNDVMISLSQTEDFQCVRCRMIFLSTDRFCIGILYCFHWLTKVIIRRSRYRQAWGKQAAGGFDWDKSQISNITIYLANNKINAVITGSDPEGAGSTPLKQWVAQGNDPGSRQINEWPTVSEVIAWAEAALGQFDGSRA